MMDGRYKYEKTLVFTEFANVACVSLNNHFVYEFNFLGITKPPFFLIGVTYEPFIWNDDSGTITKVFNYNDPLINARFEIATQSSQDVLGDNVALEIDTGTWARYAMFFSPGKVHDFRASPIEIREMTLYFMFDIFFDSAFVENQLYVTQNFILMIGTN